MESLEHLITRSIRTYYKNRLIAPIIYLCFMVVIAVIYPVMNLIAPSDYSEDGINLSRMHQEDERFGTFKLYNLYFTGYIKSLGDNTIGYYYYTMIGNDCVVVLLDPLTCQQGEPIISEVRILGEVLLDSTITTEMLSNLATDLNWSEQGIMETVSRYTISEPDANSLPVSLVKWIYILTGLFTVVAIVTYSRFIAFPQFCPSMLHLYAYGKPIDILEQAEQELYEAPQLVAGDMYITEHYFAQVSPYGVALVPLAEILWVYKYSKLNTLIWTPLKINYYLYIVAGKRQYIRCPKSSNKDLDGIMDYLYAANPDILVGFTEENRQIVKQHRNAISYRRRLVKLLMTNI